MIKTLQKKFIITAMAAVSILLLVMLGAINVVNGWQTGRQTQRTLSMLVRNQREFPPGMEHENGGKPDFMEPPADENRAMAANYFTVRLDMEGTVIYTDVSRIASVTEEEAKRIGAEIYDSNVMSGTAAEFEFQGMPSIDGRGSVIVFLDKSNEIYSILTVLVISVTIGALCWFLMLLLVVLLSKKAILPIAENMEKQKQFVTNAGHEIKTPLAIILANTDALELHNGENKWSRNIRSQTKRLGGLMQNLLTLAKMEEGSSLLVSDFSLSALLEETLHSFEESASGKEILIETLIQPEVMLRGNRENVMQMVSILLDNAVKYTDIGGRIEVLLKKKEKNLVLQIKNSCGKLPEGDYKKLFDRFYRGDEARTQKSGGYGIGLSVAQAVVQAHKGTITAANEGQDKMVFTVKI